jgi:two-component system, NarL family, nitrate/nitrite response regulator NarL
MDREVRVVIADDECMFRVSLRQLVTAPPLVIKEVYGVDVGAGFQVAGEATSGDETVATVRSVNPDLLLLDLSMPRMCGLSALRELHAARHPVRTIILSSEIQRPHLIEAVQLGVRGLVLKDVTTELLFQAMMCVVAGQYWLGHTLVAELIDLVRAIAPPPSIDVDRKDVALTRREREVLALLAAGCANKEIARTCAVSEETVKHHLTRMFDKVGASNRLELVMMATERGLVSPP